MKHVIIGAGPAGVVAAETLRKLEPEADITLLGEEREPPYSRMALPYVLVKQIGEAGTHLRKTPGHFARQNIAVEQERVIGIDRAAKQVHAASGATYGYDRLLVATGSRPTAPPIPGIDLPGVVPCWTLADSREIASRARPGAKMLLMGAGFIGCIILEALAKTGAELTVVEMEDRMVPRMMNGTAGGMIKDWCTEHGVTVHTSTRVTAIAPGKQRPLRAELGNGAAVDADLIVSATGVRPNIELLEGSGIETGQGILVDRHMQTNDPDVFAAGDVAQGRDFSTGEYSVQAIQPTATEHGQLAARNMAGRTGAVHRGSVNMNVLDTLGLVSSSFGLWMGKPDGESAELLNRSRFRYLNLQFEDDTLIGATSLGLTQHVGVLRGLIQTRTRLGRWKDELKADPTRLMEAYLGSTQAVGFNAALLK